MYIYKLSDDIIRRCSPVTVTDFFEELGQDVAVG